MNSKKRPITILFSLTMLIAFGTVPYITFVKRNVSEVNIESITATILLLLMMCGSIAIIWCTLIVKVDENLKTITFVYPLMFQSKTFYFDEIIGFRYKYLNARVPYKSLQIRSKSGQTYILSDFETQNLKELENKFLQLFDLRKGKLFSKITQKQKEIEINNSRAFDRIQAKEIKFYLYLAIAFCIVLIGNFLSLYGNNAGKPTAFSVIFNTALIVILIATLVKLKKINY